MMKRISRQFKTIMQPYYKSGRITKDEYKDVMRKAVPSVRYFKSFYTYVTFRHDLQCTRSDVNELSNVPVMWA